MLKLNVTFEKPAKPLGRGELERVVKALQTKLKPPAQTINIKVIDQSKVAELNKRYSGQDQATDVLTFNYAEDGAGQGQPTADVVISAQHIKAQAKTAGTPEATEFALLALHGMLHVLGYDHQNPRQVAEVDDLQAKIMKAAGLTYRDFGWAL